MLTLKHLVALSVSVAVLTTSCGGSDGSDVTDPDSETAEIRYTFDAGSLPPEFQRNFRLSIRSEDATMIVIDYAGTVLHDVSEPVGDAVFEAVVDAVSDLPRHSYSCDADGGWTVDLYLVVEGDAGSADGESSRVGHTEPCDDESRAYRGELTEAVSPALELFDLDALLASGPVD